MVGTLPRRTPRRRELIHLFVQLVHQGTPVGLRGQACYARCATDCCQGLVRTSLPTASLPLATMR